MRSLLFLSLFMSTKLYAEALNLGLYSKPFLDGLSSNFLNVDHICLSLIAGLLLIAVHKKTWVLSLVLGFTAIGIALVGEFGPLPGAQFFVGLSLILLVALMSLPDRFGKYLIPSLSLTALAHGILHANRSGGFESRSSELSFMLGVLLGLAILSISFGIIMQRLRERSQGIFQEAEHLLVATASGAALAYIVISFS